eukprot:TRINITY_DN8208_c0_g1_i1.p1 TRINITY_DN8208_c0_g1~~TRINITY_DN8208_c0_g1_i1.p1  ORF type:complete len:135 (-),score=9.45 TRINITY_DN8208_c0_g1_i1:274-678(-)
MCIRDSNDDVNSNDTIAPVYTILSEREIRLRSKMTSHERTNVPPGCPTPQYAILLFLTHVPPQLTPMTPAINSMKIQYNAQDNNNVHSVTGGPVPEVPMVIPMRRFVYGSFYFADQVIINALGHMNYLWQTAAW